MCDVAMAMSSTPAFVYKFSISKRETYYYLNPQQQSSSYLYLVGGGGKISFSMTRVPPGYLLVVNWQQTLQYNLSCFSKVRFVRNNQWFSCFYIDSQVVNMSDEALSFI